MATLEKKYAEALEEIDERTAEVIRLNEKINSLESLEGYGEGTRVFLKYVQCFIIVCYKYFSFVDSKILIFFFIHIRRRSHLRCSIINVQSCRRILFGV